MLDSLDARLLAALQRDSNRPLHVIADEIGLSVSACHRRQKLLEESGRIAGYAARLDPEALGDAFEIFVEITLAAQSEAALDAFKKAVSAMANFDRRHRGRLAKLPGVAAMKSSFAIRVVKPWRCYPVRP